MRTSVFMILSTISLGSCALPDCSNAFPGQYVQDTDNCHNYYICPAGEESQACPDGGCFNPVGMCADTDSVYCSANCPGTDETTNTKAPTTGPNSKTTPITATPELTTTTQSSVTTIPGCNGEFPGTFVPDPADCQKYYICGENGHALSLETCPYGSCFNPSIRFCDVASCADCLATSDMTESTTPTTANTPNTAYTPTIVVTTSTTTKKPVMCGNDAPGTMKPDPTDCRKYFLCTSSGQWTLLSCPSDSCFFEDLNTCFQNNDFCTAFCGEEPESSTTTSTTKFTKTSTKEPTSTDKTTRVTTSTGQPSDCFNVNSFICPGKGYFAKCSYCMSEYFYCNNYGHQAQEMECTLPFVFSPDPTYPYCVRPENCPYPPIKSTTTTPDPLSGCTSISDFYCPRKGFFAKCDYCVAEYFYCDDEAGNPIQEQCNWPYMFNPDPNYPYCVQPDKCPYSY